MLGAKNFPSMNILKETFDEMKTAKALEDCKIQGWAKLVLIALERYSVALKRLTFNLR
jgi:hypothetical protein